MRQINEIIVHCTATKDGDDYSVEDVRRWHIQRGFADIGYHYLIRIDGRLEYGRNWRKIGAHCKGHNRNSLSICYVGGLDFDGKPSDTRTPQQKATMRALIENIRDRMKELYGYTISVHGHNEYANKACPCFDAHKEYD